MSLKTDIQQLHNRLDACQRKLDAARSRGDHEMISKFTDEVDQVSKKLSQLKHKQSYERNKERKSILDLPFSREITKAEQADIGKLKKSVKELVIVHPMTKMGKELRLEVMTGFAPKPF
ncbi:TPA: YibL family ribosome-associated protein [Vibrio vulnificus]|nr:YibL family ribosome-associated protein [Vibrio vulnificus]HDY8136807.1 YibL family ribosome-associated protein [Vibrio vulnificus]HDY8150279.1 YibL family ribosome-associated protein [Vibrio vulnificus]HDY8154864.1 YibL family ribosome-associated protein [Vibrio vulnificus]